MKKELSSEAKGLFDSIDQDTIIDPDDWSYHIKIGGKRELATPQLTRHLVRELLKEINEYNPNFLPLAVKTDFNLLRDITRNDEAPSEEGLLRLKNKLQELSEDSQVEFYIKCIKKDPTYQLKNTIVSAWMIDIQDVIDFQNDVELENIYYRMLKRRSEIDKVL